VDEFLKTKPYHFHTSATLYETVLAYRNDYAYLLRFKAPDTYFEQFFFKDTTLNFDEMKSLSNGVINEKKIFKLVMIYRDYPQHNIHRLCKQFIVDADVLDEVLRSEIVPVNYSRKLFLQNIIERMEVNCNLQKSEEKLTKLFEDAEEYDVLNSFGSGRVDDIDIKYVYKAYKKMIISFEQFASQKMKMTAEVALQLNSVEFNQIYAIPDGYVLTKEAKEFGDIINQSSKSLKINAENAERFLELVKQPSKLYTNPSYENLDQVAFPQEVLKLVLKIANYQNLTDHFTLDEIREVATYQEILAIAQYKRNYDGVKGYVKFAELLKQEDIDLQWLSQKMSLVTDEERQAILEFCKSFKGKFVLQEQSIERLLLMYSIGAIEVEELVSSDISDLVISVVIAQSHLPEEKTLFSMEVLLRNNKFHPFGLMRFDNLNAGMIELLIKYGFDCKQPVMKPDEEGVVVYNGQTLKEFMEEVERFFGFKMTNPLDSIIKISQLETIKPLVAHEVIKLDERDSSGYLPVDYSNSVEILEFYKEHGYSTDLTKVKNPSLAMVEKLAGENKEIALEKFIYYFIRGNFDFASHVWQNEFESLDMVDLFVQAMLNGMAKNPDINKYSSLLTLMSNAGIKILAEKQHLVANHQDSFDPVEYDFMYGLTKQLAHYYIANSKEEFKSKLKLDVQLSAEMLQLIDEVFDPANINRSQAMKALKKAAPEAFVMDKMLSSYDTFFEVLGQAMYTMDTDFAHIITTLNGIYPEQLGQEIRTFRGFNAEFSDENVQDIFKYGHRAYATGQDQKFMGYAQSNPWNIMESDDSPKWEFGGTYMSLSADMAKIFALGQTAIINKKSVLMELKLTPDQDRLCGKYAFESELIPSNLKPEQIVAIYILEDKNDDKQMDKMNLESDVFITKKYLNPYLVDHATYEVGYEFVGQDQSQIELYKALGCERQINFNSQYSTPEEFFADFDMPTLAHNNSALQADYYQGRVIPDYDSLVPHNDCDTSTWCCLI
jgi:hypothetical protein